MIRCPKKHRSHWIFGGVGCTWLWCPDCGAVAQDAPRRHWIHPDGNAKASKSFHKHGTAGSITGHA